jgi:futalosine hydrolase
MKKILLVSATANEILPLTREWKLVVKESEGLRRTKINGNEISVLLTGAGMVKTAFEMGRLHGLSFDVAINVGVAGSFNRFVAGDVVSIVSDCFPELGAENDKQFLPIDELGLGQQQVRLTNCFRNNYTAQLPEAHGITVNTVHGNEKSIARVTEQYQPFVETMESAAFIYAVNALGWPAIQLRAISNKVEKRNREEWKLDLAIENLNRSVNALIKSI